MFKGSSYSQRLGRWLEKFGFADDPFALYEADQERPYLPFFFVDRPYLHTILGDPSRPQAAFLLAGRGEGKTATREMVAYECEHARLRRRALAVRCYDFTPLVEQVHGDLAQLNARHYARFIARAVLKSLAEDVPAIWFDLLDPVHRKLLAAYVAGFADPFSAIKLNEEIGAECASIDWDGSSPRETLENLTNLVTHLGQSLEVRYQALYVLIDRVDETAAGPGAAVSLLRPIVSEGPLLEMPHAAVKFFLPIQVGQELRQAVALREDKLCIETITWDGIALRKMVEQRLLYFSNGRVERLEDLCMSKVKAYAMERLIQACDSSPRGLLRACGIVIHHHVTRTNDALLDNVDLREGIAEFEQQKEAEGSAARWVDATHTGRTPAGNQRVKGLHLDNSGHVWVDGQPLTPPLSSLEYRLLKALYHTAPKIVRHDALIQAVWPGSEIPADEQNLRKLIDRVRDRLEPERPVKKSRFIRNKRGLGYWLEIE